MTDREVLFNYRLTQARETLDDAGKMLDGNFSTRSIINRAYYAMFYSLHALFLKSGINIGTSKHSGIIALFDKEFIHNGNLDKTFSKMLHTMFDIRQESDYKELTDISIEEASSCVKKAREFLEAIEILINK